MDPNTVLTFNLSIHEANLIMEALSELPFKRVAALISNMHQQADACVAAMTKATEGKEDGTVPSNEGGAGRTEEGDGS